MQIDVTARTSIVLQSVLWKNTLDPNKCLHGKMQYNTIYVLHQELYQYEKGIKIYKEGIHSDLSLWI